MIGHVAPLVVSTKKPAALVAQAGWVLREICLDRHD